MGIAQVGPGRRGSLRLALVARRMRGGREESWHHGAAAVVEPEGRLVAWLGDPQLATFLRSAAKPFQTVAMLLSGLEAGGALALEDADLAVISASHGGRPEHTARVAALLARGGIDATALRCGAHAPLDREAAEALRAAGEQPGALHNNCSGKHAGMLLASRASGAPLESYLEVEHPLQRRVREEVGIFCGLAVEDIALGIDGCSVPTFHLPLAAAACGYATLADPAALDGDRRRAAKRVVSAMTAEPAMVAGPGRFTTRLMEVAGGRLLGKEGAEGFYAVAIRGPRPLGVAVKIADGGEACRDGVVLELLRQLEALSAAELEALEAFHRRPLRNWAGLEVGELTPCAELEWA